MFKPNFQLTEKIMKHLIEIAEAKGVIESADILNEIEQKMKRQARVRTVHFSTAIEGNRLSLDQVDELLKGHDVIARERDKQEAKNYEKVLDYIDDLVQEGYPITEPKIMEIHQLVLDRIAPGGEYRRIQNVVKNDITGEVIYTPPTSAEVPDRMSNLVRWINEESTNNIPTVIVAALTHHEFCAIHPFLDGNGRTGRALATWILYKNGYDFRKLFSLEQYFDENPEGYYENLNIADQGNLIPWLEYFTEGFVFELLRVREQVTLAKRDSKYRQITEDDFINGRQKLLIKYLRDGGFVTTKTYWSNVLLQNTSMNTARNDLKDLVEKGLLEKQGSGVQTRYTLM
jgi:Fic family protein